MYPNDEEFKETTITGVREESDGWTIQRADGWSFYCPKSVQVEPKPGMVARFYGRGLGYPVRGLFLDGQQVFYRTEAEDREMREIETFGADAADWLARWDAGHTVWSILMGGIGPGYEQCIQVTAAEILRHLLDVKYDTEAWEDDEVWSRDRDAIEKAGFANEQIEKLGLSGAQWGAALNLALCLYRCGPRAVMTDERVKDRHIQVSKNFP